MIFHMLYNIPLLKHTTNEIVLSALSVTRSGPYHTNKSVF